MVHCGLMLSGPKDRFCGAGGGAPGPERSPYCPSPVGAFRSKSPYGAGFILIIGRSGGFTPGSTKTVLQTEVLPLISTVGTTRSIGPIKSLR